MLFHQTVKQWLISGAAHLLKPEWTEVVQPVFDGCGVDWHHCWPHSPGQRIVPHVADGRQCDLAGSFEHQQHASAHHVAQGAVRLPPLPLFTQHPGKRPPALAGVCGDQLAYIEDVCGTEIPAAIPEIQHRQQYEPVFVGTQGFL